MAASPTSSTTATPNLLLEALREHLSPPILALLPTTLQLFAHFQLLSHQLQSEATRALWNHDNLIARLEEEGVEEKDLVRRGALNRTEGMRLKKIRERDQEERMFAFSVEFRRYHLAKMFSTPKLDPRRVDASIDTYFPDLPNLVESYIVSHSMLYIRCMTAEQAGVMRQYRKMVLSWSREARGVFDSDRPPSTFAHFYPGDKDEGTSKLRSLVENLLKEAEHVIKDMKAFEKIFGPGMTRQDVDAGLLGERSSLIIDGEERINGVGPSSSSSSPSFHSDSKRLRSSAVDETAYGGGLMRYGQRADDAIEVSDSEEGGQLTYNYKPSQHRMQPKSPPDIFIPQRPPRQQNVHIGDLSASSAQPLIKKRPRHSDPMFGPDYTERDREFGENLKGKKLRLFQNSELYKNKRSRASIV